MSNALANRKQQTPERAADLRAQAVSVAKRERLKAMNEARRGIPLSPETKAKISAAMKGKQNSLGVIRSTEFKKKLSDYWTGNPNHNHWVDGWSLKRQQTRLIDMGRLEYRMWRTVVFTRDDYSCQECKKRGGRLEADHIKPYSTHPELRLDVNNGRTLCRECHLKAPTHGVKAKRFKEDGSSLPVGFTGASAGMAAHSA